MGAVPDYGGAQELLFEAHFNHMKDFSGIKTAMGLTDRTYAGTRATVKAPLRQLTTRHGGYFRFEAWLKVVPC
jgi:hypothetical protein